MSIQKRWDQFGRYSTDHDIAVIARAAPAAAERPISFGDGTRALCVSASMVAICIHEKDSEKTGLLALRLDRDRGVFRELTEEGCRSMAEALLRMADMLEGGAA